MPTLQANGTVKSITDSKKQALQALISSLAPRGTPDNERLSEQQVGTLADRLEQILGEAADNAPTKAQSEANINAASVPQLLSDKGEILNEEGLPIIEITEPVNNIADSPQTPEAFIAPRYPVPLSSLSEQEKELLRARRDHILDILEAEEVRELDLEREREQKQHAEERARLRAEAQKEMDARHAAREMQKKMGKALLQSVVQQRNREELAQKISVEKEEAIKKAQKAAEQSSRCSKPKKCVSFVGVPSEDEDDRKPRAKATESWHSACSAFRPGLPKDKLNAEEIARMPMKFEVVERIPSKVQPSSVPDKERGDLSLAEKQWRLDGDDSDNMQKAVPSRDEIQGGSVHADASERFMDESENGVDGDDDSEFDLSEARIQREAALEYLRLRQTVGIDADQAMISCMREGEDDWDQSDVPLEASSAAKPPESGAPHFGEIRREDAVQVDRDDKSVSPGGAVLTGRRASTLERAVRVGKLEDGRLVGGEEGESASEDENAETTERTLEMLKDGVLVHESRDTNIVAPPGAVRETLTAHRAVQAPSAPPSESTATAMALPRKSRFLSERSSRSGASPTLSTMVIDSPSFPRTVTASPGTIEGIRETQPVRAPAPAPVLIADVRESSQRSGPQPESTIQASKQQQPSAAPKRISRFMAERL